MINIRRTVTLALAGTLTGLAALFTPAASALPAPTPQPRPGVTDHCRRAGPLNHAICHDVHAQHAYGMVSRDGTGMWSRPAGRILVGEITGQGLTWREMRDALHAERASYRAAVTHVTVNMDHLPNTDCEYRVGFHDEDGKPGGRKLTRITVDCP